MTLIITHHFQLTTLKKHFQDELLKMRTLFSRPRSDQPPSGIAYIRCSNWKECPFFCPEESIHGYQQCVCDRVIPEYKVCEGGKPLLCKHMDTPTLRVSRSAKNPFRPYFTCRTKEMCRYFQWGDEIPVDAYSQREPPVYKPRETEVEIMKKRWKTAAKTQASETICQNR